MIRQFYAIGNHYASATSRGFMNTEFVRIFATAEKRDAWLRSSAKAVKACNKKQAINAIVGNATCVGEAMTRAEAWHSIQEYNDLLAF